MCVLNPKVQPMEHPFINKHLAEAALRLSLPSIEAMLQSGVTKRKHLCIFIGLADVDEESGFKQLHRHNIGDPEEWEHHYDEYALAKAVRTVRESEDTINLDQQPWTVAEGDTVYFGSAQTDDMIVAASGVEAHFDTMFSRTIVTQLEGLCRHIWDLFKKDGQYDILDGPGIERLRQIRDEVAEEIIGEAILSEPA